MKKTEPLLVDDIINRTRLQDDPDFLKYQVFKGI